MSSTVQSTKSSPNPLAKNSAFEEKPIKDRIADDGIGKLLEVILKQRYLLNEQASRGQESGQPRPEVRVDYVSRNGAVRLYFTEKMQFPDNIAELINY